MSQNLNGLYVDLNQLDQDYATAIYNLETRIQQYKNKNAYLFCESDYTDLKELYDKERNECIQRSLKKINKLNDNTLITEYDKNNVHLWDISFASKWGFPHNRVGFNGQWMSSALAKIAPYLLELDYNENSHICYRQIEEGEPETLDYLCSVICNREHEGRTMSGSGKDFTATYQYYVDHYNKTKKEEDKPPSFERCFHEYNCIEKHPIGTICPNYDTLYCQTSDRRLNSDELYELSSHRFDTSYGMLDIILSLKNRFLKYDDIDTYTLFMEHFDEWNIIIDKLKDIYDNDMGQMSFPFWTLFLPEYIKEFSEVRVLTKDGNFTEIVARSEKYWYYMQYVN